MVLVDTSVWVELIRGGAGGAAGLDVQKLLRSTEAAWCAPIRMELWPYARSARELAFLRVLASLVVELTISPAVWDDAIELASKARSSGINCPMPDLLISACARVHGVELLHRDKHFDQLAAL